MHEPWFKLFASDYLLDADVDAMPREAGELLLRMWCVCHIHGYCPSDPEELARLTRCKLSYVSQNLSHCLPLFELRGDRLYSRRMEREKEKSAAASKSAKTRWDRNAKRNANRNAQKSGSGSGSGSNSPEATPISPCERTSAATAGIAQLTSRDIRNVAREVQELSAGDLAGHADKEAIFEIACDRWELNPSLVRAAAGRSSLESKSNGRSRSKAVNIA
ncbi:MAG: hypothetical protein JWN74_2306 [Acidobacteriaceae bacterium]|nr:hypothetical protein [Acidobacteriaceae bacterium]